MENAGGKCAVNIGALKYVEKMTPSSGTPGRDQWNYAIIAHELQLLDVVTAANAIAVHAIQYDLARTAILSFGYPLDRQPVGGRHFVRVTGELINVVIAISMLAVDTNDDALRSEAPGEIVNKLRIGQGRRVNRNFVRALVQHIFCVANSADTAGDAERDVDNLGYFVNPATIDTATFRAGRDVIEYEFIGTLTAVSLRQFDNVADDFVIAKLDTLDDQTIANIEAGNQAFCWNDTISAVEIFPSRSARPVIAAGMPRAFRASRS